MPDSLPPLSEIEDACQALKLGMEYDVRLDTPLMWLNKAETWALADYHHQLDLVREHSGAYGMGVDYAYTMVHGAPERKA